MINKAGHFTISKWFLLFVSLWFYGYAGIKGLLIICGITAVNYIIYLFGLKPGKETNKNAAEKLNHTVSYKLSSKSIVRKICLFLGIAIDVVALLYFKYFVFAEITLNKHFGTSFLYTAIAAPLGISFITFSQISFLVDNYREYGDVSVLDYFIYVLFFPKVTVGPIALSTEFIPQLNDNQRKLINFDNIAKGLFAFSLGLAKKVLLADLMAKYADYGFMHIDGLGPFNAFIVMVAYTMQIYFDFSGFCDMAFGICLMMNFDIPQNFNSPYRALSIGEFWDRWHITLTKFFTKYIYIPLGGSRKGKVRTYVNIMIVFLVSGIWHGAATTFIVWGLLHGIGSCLSRATKDVMVKVPKAVRWLGTFLFVNITWVFFRAWSIEDAVKFIKELFSFKYVPVAAELIAKATPKEYEIIQWIIAEFTELNTYYTGLPVFLILAFCIFASIKMKNTNERIDEFKASGKVIAATVILLVLSVISLSEISGFIYVNF